MLMNYQHDAQIANIVTSYCTCLGGILPILFTVLTKRQPARWMFAYVCVLITGVFTVLLHANEGNRLASFFDVGTNIVLAWALQVAVSGDFLKQRPRCFLVGASSLVNLAVLAWLLYEVTAPQKVPLLKFGEFGQFYAGEVALIINCWVVAGLFFGNLGKIPMVARPLLYVMFSIFFVGMLLATASNSQISFGILPWHAVWHILGMVGFITMWVFNTVRFDEKHDLFVAAS
jgi:hypothetical protein